MALLEKAAEASAAGREDELRKIAAAIEKIKAKGDEYVAAVEREQKRRGMH